MATLGNNVGKGTIRYSRDHMSRSGISSYKSKFTDAPDFDRYDDMSGLEAGCTNVSLDKLANVDPFLRARLLDNEDNTYDTGGSNYIVDNAYVGQLAATQSLALCSCGQERNHMGLCRVGNAKSTPVNDVDLPPRVDPISAGAKIYELERNVQYWILALVCLVILAVAIIIVLIYKKSSNSAVSNLTSNK